jgi:hypothetical protein
VSPDFSSNPRPRRQRLLDLVALGLATILATAAAHAAWNASRLLTQTRAALAAKRSEIVADQSGIRAQEAKGAHLSEELAARILASHESTPQHVLSAIGRLLPAGARLDNVTLTYGAEVAVDLHVVAREPATYDRFLERIESSLDFRDIVFGSENRDGEMQVSLKAVFRGAQQ